MVPSEVEYIENLSKTELLIETAYEDGAIGAVRAAERRIWILAYRWRWYRDFPEKPIQRLNVEILKAHRRGVQVRAIVQDSALLPHLRGLSLDVRAIAGSRLMHSKAILVDQRALLLGSHNLTDRAFRHNREMSIIAHDLEPILQFETYFDGLWRHGTE